ncbi:hypothetical protein ACFY2K_40095 [Kitasatospora sp. NPDC001309]|uniref:hypothetical protein n=1 Tax=Kitasatospora sp. NPDC001309 TaxID=3364013 RepID=UPI0036C3CAD0
MGNLADTYGTDVEIYRGGDGRIWADCRTDAPGLINRTLRQFGFTAPTEPGNPASYSLPPERPSADQLTAASGAAYLLSVQQHRVAIEPQLVVSLHGRDDPAELRRAAALATSAATRVNATVQQPPAPPKAAAERPSSRTR